LPGTRVSAQEQPRTIHDFGGFPPALFAVRYPAPGAPALAARVAALLAPTAVELDTSWGLDHGTWSLLVHMYPEADVPVIQLSIDETLPAREHYALAQKLGALRAEGVLVLGSGNVVHNLHAYAWGRKQVEPYDWGLRFEQTLRGFIEGGELARVADYEQLGQDAALSAPTPEHFLPLLYVLALQQPGEPIRFPTEGFDGGSISMLSLRVG
jgi:4,5-DOPA dioxygenase extradiol